MKMRFGMIVAFALVLCGLSPAQAAVPGLINFQGHLTDDTGSPVVDGSYSMAFAIYDVELFGTAQWSESHSSVSVIDGIYNVQLGAVIPLDSSVFEGGVAWLEVVVDGETLSPRQRITATAFALKAEDADHLIGNTLADLDARYVQEGEAGAVNSTMIADGTIGAADLGANSVGASEIGSSAVGTSEVADNSLTAADLAAGSVGSSEVADNSLTAADLAANSVGNSELASNSVGSAEVIDNSLTANDLAAGSVGASEIATGAVASSEIADGSVTDADMKDGAALAEILDDDGPGSGLNADLLDNHDAAFFSAATHWHYSLNASDGSPADAVVVDSAGNVAMGGDVTDPADYGLYVQNYTFDRAAVRGTDQSGTNIYAEGRLGVLSPSGLPYNPYNIGVLGLKPNLGGDGAAVYGWNNDDNSANYAMYAVADGPATGSTAYKNYGLYAKAANASINYAGYFDGDVVLDSGSAYGGGTLKLLDNTGVETVSLTGTEWGNDGPELELRQVDGTVTFELDAEDGVNGGPVLTMRNSANTSTIFIDADSADAAYVALRNSSGSTTISLDADYGGDGRITTQELQITGGSDLSEQFDIGGEDVTLAPGLVVSIDPNRPGHLQVSNAAYDNKVAGIISGAGGIKPGMMMGQSGTEADGQHPVALTGRVYCWADATADPIQPGDLLTTAERPGHAMKVTDHTQANGAILGKAMTALEKGTGLVLVLVSLQ